MIADILCKKEPLDEEALSKEDNYLHVHKEMILKLIKEGYSKTKEEAAERVIEYVNKVCKNILENTAVFKSDEIGQKGFMNFLNSVEII